MLIYHVTKTCPVLLAELPDQASRPIPLKKDEDEDLIEIGSGYVYYPQPCESCHKTAPDELRETVDVQIRRLERHIVIIRKELEGLRRSYGNNGSEALKSRIARLEHLIKEQQSWIAEHK